MLKRHFKPFLCFCHIKFIHDAYIKEDSKDKLYLIWLTLIVTHFFAQSQASGTALFWAIHM